MGLETVNQIFYSAVGRQSDRVMMYKQADKWIPVSSAELYRNVVGVARTLQQWGISKGDRVAILSENRPEWAIADFATLLLGAVVVPIYCTLTAEQTAHILKDAGARVIFLSTAEQFKKFVAVKNQVPIEKAVVMDDGVTAADAIPIRDLLNSGPTARDPGFDARCAAVRAADLATIIYTSGTTGVPKGAMLTHGNLASNVDYSLRGFPVGAGDIGISFLPLAHITARHVDYTFLHNGVTVAYCPLLDQLPIALTEVRPTIFVAVPRVYEKIYARIQQRASKGAKRSIVKWALQVGHSHQDDTLNDRHPNSLSWRLADLLFFSQVRKGVGGRVKIFLSGGAPLGRELARWFADAGIRIDEGYGLTETSPVIAVNNPKAHKLGTVGKPLPNVQVKIADDGEILVRGPSVFSGYWNLPEQTKNAFTDGWFNTGDIGNLDPDGFLSVTDRKKDLLKTSGGKFITPQPIQKSLQLDSFVAEAVVIGDRRKFPSVIIAPQFPMLEDWARANQLPFSSREELVANPKVRELYEKIVGNVNQNLARYEQLKKFVLVPHEFSIADGTLTPSMKLKRSIIEERYREQIDQLYSEPVPAVTSER
jgi:long-chain acyl-CoA synthetase